MFPVGADSVVESPGLPVLRRPHQVSCYVTAPLVLVFSSSVRSPTIHFAKTVNASAACVTIFWHIKTSGMLNTQDHRPIKIQARC